MKPSVKLIQFFLINCQQQTLVQHHTKFPSKSVAIFFKFLSYGKRVFDLIKIWSGVSLTEKQRENNEQVQHWIPFK